MAQYREDILDIELESGNVHRSFLNHMIGAGDAAGQRFGVKLKRNGEPVSMAGAACVGYFIRPDGITLVINGEISNGIGYIELPEAACAVEGGFSLAIKISGTGFENTIRIVDGTIVKTTTGTINDPSGQIPSLADLLAVIEQAEEAAADIDGISITETVISGTRYKITVTKE